MSLLRTDLTTVSLCWFPSTFTTFLSFPIHVISTRRFRSRFAAKYFKIEKSSEKKKYRRFQYLSKEIGSDATRNRKSVNSANLNKISAGYLFTFVEVNSHWNQKIKFMRNFHLIQAEKDLSEIDYENLNLWQLWCCLIS